MGIKVKSTKELKNNKIAPQNINQSNEVLELKKRLYYDAVLGCQNRTKFEEDAKQLGSEYTFFSLDANNLKYVNDNINHEAGDALLKITVECGIAVWGTSQFYRQGGDEFSVLIRGQAQSDEVSNKQISYFKQLIDEQDKRHPDFPIAVSVGYATNNDGADFKDVIAAADKVMYADKKAYKELHPELDMRKAVITIDSLKEAIKQGEVSKAYKELREEQGLENKSSVKEVVLIEDDETFEGISDNTESLDEKKEVNSELVVIHNENFSGVDVSNDEFSYEANEFSKKVQPVLRETTEKAVKSAVRYQNDKLKLEVAEVLDDEVSYRLSKYEKRRRKRDFKEKVRGITKTLIIIFIILFVLGNKQLRLRFAIVTKDLGDMVSCLMRGEDTSSNKLVEDLFRDLGEDINKENTVNKTSKEVKVKEKVKEKNKDKVKGK